MAAVAVVWWSWARLAAERAKKEPTLAEAPLHLAADASPLEWECCVCDESTRSFASLLRNPFEKERLAEWFRTAAAMPSWRQPPLRGGMPLPRRAAWFVRAGCRCAYEYGGTRWPPEAMPAWLLDVERGVWAALRGGEGEGAALEAPNSCVLNLYEDGRNLVDWHADDEPLFQGQHRDCCIVSLSLGAARQFDLRRRRALGPKREHVALELCDGDVLTMEGLFQKHWQHRVPRRLEVSGPRINFTWRTIALHSAADGCPLAASCDPAAC